ncbi:MAG: glycosyltransferase family 9 protein, partial [Opitutaceae bacterium]
AGARAGKRSFPRKPWLGERPIRGRTLFLQSEQGFGDMIQFVRFAPLLARLGARVHLEAEAPLARLFQASFPEIEAIHLVGAPIPQCEEHCTVPSLPLAFGTELASIPAAIPYLRAPEPLPPLWGETASAGPFRVGLAWSGNPAHHNDRNRSIPFARFRLAFDGLDRRFVSLQKDVRPADAAVFDATSSIVHAAHLMTDFAATAALVEQLDLVVSVDTAVAHLAAALGKAVWLLLPYAPDWRWMLGRTDSPWYPTMRLFRQPRAGDWDSVLAEVRANLKSDRWQTELDRE